MNRKIFNLKLNKTNYNKFNETELDIINKEIARQILDMEPVLRIILTDFCENLSIPAIDLLKMGEFDYIVDYYLNNKEV